MLQKRKWAKYRSRKWAKHRAFVRSFPCAVHGCRNPIIQCAHLRTAANAGTGLKPADYYCIPLCHHHHREMDRRLGWKVFQQEYGLDLFEIAATLAAKSPDQRMRQYLREIAE